MNAENGLVCFKTRNVCNVLREVTKKKSKSGIRMIKIHRVMFIWDQTHIYDAVVLGNEGL